MKIPAFLYGRAGEAGRRVQRVVRELLQTRDFGSYDPGPMLEIDDVSGDILVRPDDVRKPQFHCYMLSDRLIEAAPQENVHAVVHDWLMASLHEEWRFYCTLSGEAWFGLQKAGRADATKYVDASVAHWPAMARIRHRFGPQLSELDILHLWTTLFWCVERLGVTLEQRTPYFGAEPSVLRNLVDKVNCLQ